MTELRSVKRGNIRAVLVVSKGEEKKNTRKEASKSAPGEEE